MGVGRRIINSFCVTGHAGVVCLLLGLEAVPAAAGVTGDTVKLARLEAWTHEPRGVSVIFPKIAAIGVKVRVLKGDKVIMVEEFFARSERGRQGNHLSMTDRTCGIVLVRSKLLRTDNF